MAVFAVYLTCGQSPVLVEADDEKAARRFFADAADAHYLLGVVPAGAVRTAEPGPVKHG